VADHLIGQGRQSSWMNSRIPLAWQPGHASTQTASEENLLQQVRQRAGKKNSDFAVSRIKSDFAIRYKNQVLYFQLCKIYFVKYSSDRTIICAQFFAS
jgi:hypothetical protein